MTEEQRMIREMVRRFAEREVGAETGPGGGLPLKNGDGARSCNRTFLFFCCGRRRRLTKQGGGYIGCAHNYFSPKYIRLPGETKTVRIAAGEAERYGFLCPYHEKMRGTVQIERRCSMIPTVERLISKKIFSIPSERSVREAAEQMAGHAIGSPLVSRNGAFVGILTEVDIVRKVVAEGLDPILIPIAQVMTSPLITIEADRSVVEATDLMEGKKIRHLAVTQRGEIIGMISVRDFLHPLHLEQAATGF